MLTDGVFIPAHVFTSCLVVVQHTAETLDLHAISGHAVVPCANFRVRSIYHEMPEVPSHERLFATSKLF